MAGRGGRSASRLSVALPRAVLFSRAAHCPLHRLLQAARSCLAGRRCTLRPEEALAHPRLSSHFHARARSCLPVQPCLLAGPSCDINVVVSPRGSALPSRTGCCSSTCTSSTLPLAKMHARLGAARGPGERRPRTHRQRGRPVQAPRHSTRRRAAISCCHDRGPNRLLARDEARQPQHCGAAPAAISASPPRSRPSMTCT